MAIINGTCGDDDLSSVRRGDILFGGDGDDMLLALHGFNILIGGDGDDQLTALSSFNILSGGEGNDTLRAHRGWNLLLGGDGDDILSSSADGNILDGGDGNDLFNILGGSGNTVKGGAGRDTVSYEGATQGVAVNLAAGTAAGIGMLSGIENVIGSDGDDIITGDANDNVLEGGGGKDTIEGGAGNDIVDGGAGDDLIIGGTGAGDDTYIGGGGSDTVSYASTTLGVTVNLAGGTATGAEIGTDTLSSIENIVGGAGDDILAGDANDNSIDGGDGNDTIRGGAGNDILIGGAGIDTLSYEDSPNRVIVNMFMTSSITIGGVTVDPGHAFDGFSAPPPLTIPPTPAPADTISGFENVIGSAFDDWIQGISDVANRFVGGAGNDMLAGSGASDGINVSVPGSANDTLFGGAGNDVLRQTRGNDFIDGGEGFDRLEFINNGIAYGGAIGVNVNLALNTSDADPNNGDAVNDPLVNGRDDIATVSGIEHVLGTAGNDTLIGDGNANRLEGQGGNDFIDGGNGNDTIRGGTGDDVLRQTRGNDFIDGGEGFDRLDFVNNGISYAEVFGVNVNLGAGTSDADAGGVDSINGPGGDVAAVSGIEHVLGTAGNDILIGDGNANRLEGAAGSDMIDGGAGNDTIRGGAGSDLLVGGADIDSLLYDDSPNGVIVNMFMTTSVTVGDLTVGPGRAFDGFSTPPLPFLPTDSISGFENVVGSDYDDYMQGVSNVANRFEGGDGSDTLVGSGQSDSIAGAWDDTLLGGTGDDELRQTRGADHLDGGDGSDRLAFTNFGSLSSTGVAYGGAVGVNVNLAVGTSDYDTSDGLNPVGTLVSIENVTGTGGNDSLTGDDFANRLEGQGGNDTIGGGTTDAANDTLLGGAGNDSLRQTRGNDSIDGGDGFDSLAFFTGIAYGGAVGVNVDLAAGTSDADASTPGDVATISSIEFVTGNFGNDVFTGGDLLHAPVLATGQTEFFQPLGGNDTINGAPGRGWSAAVDYSTNTSLQPVTVVLGNSDNFGTALDGFDSDSLTVGVQPYTDTLIEVDYARGGAGNDLLVGGSYNQGLSGVFVEAFRGNAGNDTIDGGGSDTMIGAYGVTDRVEYNNSPFAVVVNLGTDPISGNFYGAGVITVNGGTARDGFSSTGGGTDTLIDINVVRGSNFSDTLVGGNPKFDNNERFEGLAGNDSIDGGSGNDEADYSSSTAAVLVNIGSNMALDGFGGTDTLVSVEWARGGSSNDTLIGGANALERLMGGQGNDSIDGGSMTGVNYASFVLGTSGASASIANGVGSASNDGQGGTDTLVNINGLWGSNFDDTLTGGGGDQWFLGSGGSDSIDGGADTDTVSYASDPNGVTVNLGTNSATDGWGGIWGLQGTDTLISIENVEGSSFNDNITGDANANLLDGGGGNDTIDGGGGSNVLSGGAGADVFQFGPSAAGNTITDFDDDVLDFSQLFTGSETFVWLLSEGYLLVDSTGNVGGGAANDTVVQVDVDGAGAGGSYTAVTLIDVTLGTTGIDADNWLV